MPHSQRFRYEWSTRPETKTAVFNYLKTGRVWNGHDTPVIGSQHYVGIINEIKTATDYPENPNYLDSWSYNLPTNLVILQVSDSPLDETGLPCYDSAGCQG